MWSDAARQAAIEARRANAKGTDAAHQAARRTIMQWPDTAHPNEERLLQSMGYSPNDLMQQIHRQHTPRVSTICRARTTHGSHPIPRHFEKQRGYDEQRQPRSKERSIHIQRRGRCGR